MSTPHGSKPVEFVRYLANRLLSDSQRKAIKNALARLQRLPLRLLGLEGIVEDQRAQIERLKARIAILDGKLNLALYGLPVLGEHKATLLSNSLLPQLEPTPALQDSLARLRQNRKCAYPKVLAESLSGAASRILFLGDAPGLVEWGTQSTAPARIRVAEPDPERRRDLERKGEKFEILPTAPLNALIGCPDSSEPFIVCVHRLQELSPFEQIHLLDLAVRKLAPGGTLCVELPAVESGAQDLYWSDPLNLRPYSATLFREVLGALPGTLTEERSEGSLVFLFRKAR